MLLLAVDALDSLRDSAEVCNTSLPPTTHGRGSCNLVTEVAHWAKVNSRVRMRSVRLFSSRSFAPTLRLITVVYEIAPKDSRQHSLNVAGAMLDFIY